MWLPDSLVLRMVFTILARLGPVSFPARRRHLMHDPEYRAWSTGPSIFRNATQFTLRSSASSQRRVAALSLS